MLYQLILFLVTQPFQDQFGKGRMKFTFSEIEALAEATHGQRQNNRWHMERVGRILGSSMRDTFELGHELLEHNMNRS